MNVVIYARFSSHSQNEEYFALSRSKKTSQYAVWATLIPNPIYTKTNILMDTDFTVSIFYFAERIKI